MPNFTPLINGKAYEWADITLNIMGVPIAGVTAIDYEEDQDMSNNYGAGNKPVSRSYGQIKYDNCKITLHAEEVVALQKVAPNGRIQEIPEFDIIVSYIPDGGAVTTDILKAVRFTKNSRTPKAGDSTIEVEIPLIVGDIKWGK